MNQYRDRIMTECQFKENWRKYKENKMKEKVEMPDKSTVLAVARKCPDAKEVLKGLFPEAFEEKEIVIKNGQIYKFVDNYFLLEKSYDDKTWDLVDLRPGHYHWRSRQTDNQIKEIIKNIPFTLCPHATITVKENTSYSSGNTSSN